MSAFDINSILPLLEKNSPLITVITGLIVTILALLTFQHKRETVSTARKRIESIFSSNEKFIKILKIDEFYKENIVVEYGEITFLGLVVITFLCLYYLYFMISPSQMFLDQTKYNPQLFVTAVLIISLIASSAILSKSPFCFHSQIN